MTAERWGVVGRTYVKTPMAADSAKSLAESVLYLRI
jgi:hypothetical protein